MKKKLILFILSNLLFQGGFAFGECVVGKENKQEYSNPYAAGCFIITPKERIVLTMNNHDEAQLLIGKSLPNETAQCTAIRETREESSINVIVGKLLHKFPGKFQKMVYLFHCEADSNTDFSKLRTLDEKEVKKVILVDPKTLATEKGDKPIKWRFPNDRALVIKLFKDLTS